MVQNRTRLCFVFPWTFRRFGLVQDLVILWSAPVWSGSLVWFGLVWFVLVRFGLVRFGPVRFRVFKHLYGSVRCETVASTSLRIGVVPDPIRWIAVHLRPADRK